MNRGRSNIGRIGALFVLGALVLVSVGDRAFAVVGRGIDPLDTLDRTAKPNVIVVLDNSDSMRTTPYFNGGVGPGTGDWSLSKLAIAKSTLQTIIANNQSRANFMLASYRNANTPAFTTTASRFYYVHSTTGAAPPFAATPFSFYTWQDLQPTWNTLYWTELAGTFSGNPTFVIGSGANDKFYWRELDNAGQFRYRTCTVSIPAAQYGTYNTDAQMSTLAANLTTLLSSAGSGNCTRNHNSVGFTPVNDYTVTWAGAPTFRFTITASGDGGGAVNQPYQFMLDATTDSVFDNLGFPTSLPNPAGNYTLANPGTTSADFIPTGTTTSTGANISVAVGATGVTCSAVIPAVPYSSGINLALALSLGMGGVGRTCNGGTTNVYGNVTFNAGTGQFEFGCLGACLTDFTINWQTSGGAPPPTNNIAGALGKGAATDATTNLASGTTTLTSGSLSVLADYQAANSQTTDLIGATTRTNHVLSAGRFFNGQTLGVDAAGQVCSIANGSATDPPTVNVQPLFAGCGGNNGAPVTFTFAGANWGDDVSGTAGIPGTGSCQGYQSVVNLVACNDGTPQATTFANALSPGIQLGGTSPHTPVGYSENATNGSYALFTSPSPLGMIAFETATPLASSINGVRGAFSTLYSAGNFGLTPISSHTQPRERTIVVMITDGTDTCAITAGTSTDDNALAAAYQAELMYRPISGSLNQDGTYVSPGVTTDVASSVNTYVVGFGNGVNTAIDTNRLNWIAWGGSGLGLNSFSPMGNNGTKWNSIPTSQQREQCLTCSDAFIALDGPALQTVLQAILDQATSSEGIFSATQAIQASPFELADVVTGLGSLDPKKRYDALVPLGFESVFTMPGFRGTIRAIGNSGGSPFVFWDAGQKLLTSVQASMTAGIPAASSPTGVAGEGNFAQLHAGATHTDVRTHANTGIRRRIYTTIGNGTFPVVDTNFTTLFSGSSPCRVALWPPNSSATPPAGGCAGDATVASNVVAPADDSTEGVLDVALGLPSNAAIGADAAGAFTTLQTTFEACVASPPASAAPSANCSSASAGTKALRARREARETILAYIAGAAVVLDTAGYPRRATSSAGAFAIGDIVYRARPWLMSESTLSSAAVIGPPIEITPGTTGFVDEYNLYRDGLPANRTAADTAINGLAAGFGLRNPDKDDAVSAPVSGDDSRPSLKPVMTAVYVGANDMLHAFRAGPSCNNPATNFSGCVEQGGEEMWGFVPFDRLFVLRALLKPQTRGNKTYGIASGVRFADAFINAPGGTYSSSTPGSPVTGRGVWRQIVAFGRGQGGKSYTVLDVTGRGAFTGRALDTPGPIVLWNRGNPDTVDGTGGGSPNGSTAEANAYAKMGETWSVPAISFVDKNLNNGTSVVLYTGSGYGDSANPGEGSFFYTLDAITGDVIASVDVEAAAATNSVTRVGLSYSNALVAGPAAFSAIQLTPLQAGHPSEITSRVYFGDLHGRLWKINSASPDQVVLMGDVGVDQPLGVSPALISLGSPVKPHIYLASGNDSRAPGPFKIFGYRDDSGSDTNNSAGTRAPSVDDALVFDYLPQSKSLFVKALQDSVGNQYRGTIQPATAFTTGSPVNGRVFFGGTRFTGFNATIPCLATFDTIIFALGAETGGAAYDLNASGDDAYVVFSNSRKLAIQVIRQPGADPASTQPAKLFLDEGLMSGGTSPNPPAPPGFAAAIVPQPPSVTLTLRTGSNTNVFGTNYSVFPQFSAPRVCQ